MRNTVLGSVAGSGAIAIHGAAEALFAAAGKGLLGEGARQGLRSAMVRHASWIVSTFAPGLSLGAREAARLVAEQGAQGVGAVATGQAGKLLEGAPAAAKALTREAAKGAGKTVLAGAGKAAGIGFVLDGALGAYEGLTAYRRGEVTRNEAIAHAAKEASTGAVATGVGVLLASGLVAVTGGVATPVVFAVGAGGAIGAKQLLKQVVDRVGAGQDRASRVLG